MRTTILVLNGPNLNLLGRREPSIYGTATLADLQRLCEETAAAVGLTVDFRQSNHEGVLVDWIQGAAGQAGAIIINAAAFSHTSVAIQDALKSFDGPIVEVHLSNIYRREAFRHHSFVSAVATGVICGLGPEGYRIAISALARNLVPETGRAIG